MANEMRPELTIAACRLASVPPSTATIMTFFQKLPPILSPTKARMLAWLAPIVPNGATPWKAKITNE